KNTLEGNLGRSSKDARNLVGLFETDRRRDSLSDDAVEILCQSRATVKRRHRFRYHRPTAAEDKLFDPGYVHMHRGGSDCGCEILYACLQRGAGSIVRGAPEIIIDAIGPGDTATKSAEHRNKVSKKHDIFAYEMDGAGVRDEQPSIVVKEICGYADTHKNDQWQTLAVMPTA
ncbi:hypothetical protein LY78DRAFT_547866, partial [Colletotrichum sublineola]